MLNDSRNPLYKEEDTCLDDHSDRLNSQFACLP